MTVGAFAVVALWGAYRGKQLVWKTQIVLMPVTIGVAALCHAPHPTCTLEQAGGGRRGPAHSARGPGSRRGLSLCAAAACRKRLLRIQPSAQLRDKVVAPGKIHVGPLPEQLDRGVTVPAVEQISHLGDQCGIELP